MTTACAALRLGARLVPEDGEPALDRLAAERVRLLGPGRNRCRHDDQQGRDEDAYDDRLRRAAGHNQEGFRSSGRPAGPGYSPRGKR